MSVDELIDVRGGLAEIKRRPVRIAEEKKPNRVEVHDLAFERQPPGFEATPLVFEVVDPEADQQMRLERQHGGRPWTERDDHSGCLDFRPAVAEVVQQREPERLGIEVYRSGSRRRDH